MIFRLADKNDAPTLAKMRWDFQTEFGDVPVCSEDEFIAHCSLFFSASVDNCFHWIAQEGATIIGTVSVYHLRSIPKPNDLNPSWGYLTNTYIIPAYRNQAIGSALMHHVKEWAKQKKMELLIAWPSEKSLNFYMREGFKNNPELLELPL